MSFRRIARAAPLGLRTRLILLVLASVLPFLLLIGIVARRQFVQQKPMAAAQALARARDLARDLDLLLRDIETTGRATTHALSPNASHRAENDQTLREIAGETQHPFTSWALVAPDGTLVGTSGPNRAMDDDQLFRSLVEGIDDRSRRVITGPVKLPAGEYAIHMIIPMRGDDGGRAFLVAQILLRAFRPLLMPRDVPAGSSLAIHSDKGRVLGRYPEPDKWVGGDIAGTPLDSAVVDAFDGPTEYTTTDGVHRLLAVTRMEEVPWRVGVGVPTAVLFARARGDVIRTFSYGGLALALAIGLALWQASRIVGPIKRLSADASKLGTGDLAHRSGVLGNDELGGLARTINEMATTLEHQGTVLRESEERYRNLFDINPLPMWVIDPETLNFLAVNKAAIETYGYSEAEFRRMKTSEIRAPEDVPDLIRKLAETRSRTGRYVTRHRRKDGMLFPVEVDAGPITFAGRPARLITARDISERVRAEEALRNAEAQLRQSQRLEAVGQLTGGIAHDFNNVLTAIGSYSDFLYESLDAGDARRLDVQEIRKAAERATGLTKQLLAFSRSQILQPRVLDVNESLAELESMLRRVLTAEIELVLKLDPEAGRVRADPGQLSQVLLNLAVNARDAMPDGGVLTISTRNERLTDGSRIADGGVEMKPGDYVVIDVADSGVGMDPQTRQRIFEPFFTTKKQGEGTGLGLSTVYGIVDQSGGYISTESAVGNGTTFTIRFPRVHQPVEPERPVPEAAVAGQRSEVILVVEDEESLRRATKRILIKKGYTVLEAANGKDALQVLQSQSKVDLLLTDLVMPGMGGRELVRVLKEQDRAIPTLYMSGYTKDAVMRVELDPGIMVLEKPFSQAELAAKVREVLDNHAT